RNVVAGPEAVASPAGGSARLTTPAPPALTAGLARAMVASTVPVAAVFGVSGRVPARISVVPPSSGPTRAAAIASREAVDRVRVMGSAPTPDRRRARP